jgi:hypothetical protein
MSIGSISYLAMVNKSLENDLSLYARVLAENNISYAPSLFSSAPIAGNRVIQYEIAANSASATAKYLASQKEQFDGLSEKFDSLVGMVDEMISLAEQAQLPSATSANQQNLMSALRALQSGYTNALLGMEARSVSAWNGTSTTAKSTKVNAFTHAAKSIKVSVGNSGVKILFTKHQANKTALNIKATTTATVLETNKIKLTGGTFATIAEARLNTARKKLLNIQSSIENFANIIGYFEDIQSLNESTNLEMIQVWQAPDEATVLAEMAALEMQIEENHSYMALLLESMARHETKNLENLVNLLSR